MNHRENKSVKMNQYRGKKVGLCQIYTIEDNKKESKSKEKFMKRGGVALDGSCVGLINILLYK